MHLLLIHQAFALPKDAGGTRHFEFARRLVRQGHTVTIITSPVSYQTGTCREMTIQSEEIFDGVRVLRAYAFPSLHWSFAWRIFSFMTFMLSSAWTALRCPSVDLVMGTSPPIFQAVSAWTVAALRRRPFLLEVRDLWPDFAVAMGVLKNPLLLRASRWLERFIYLRARHVLVNSPAYRSHVIRKGVPEARVTLVANGVDPTMFYPGERAKDLRKVLGIDDKFVVTYAGALGLANDIGQILRAADRLRMENDIHFLLVGDGKERGKLETSARSMGLENVTFAGSKPKTEMPRILAASDACIATLQDIEMFRTTYPNKVFDYMAAGRPTILAIDGVIREVIEKSEGGVFVRPGDDATIAEAILTLRRGPELAKRMGAAARRYVALHFNRDQQAEEFRQLVTDVARRDRGFYRSRGKRVFDLLATVAIVILLVPLLLSLGLAVRLLLGRPVMFRQTRPGCARKPFKLLKFRSMTDDKDSEGRLLPDEARLTTLGRFMRRTSLDELPELLNVITGDMSLVGPRPLLVEYLDRYTTEQARRHEVRPGMTGWAQVNGRNALSWEEKFKLDVWYIENLSFRLDIKILAFTAWKVLKGEGISQPGHATMEEFLGSDGKQVN